VWTGVPVGALLGDPDAARPQPAGSCIAVVATDAPLQSSQLARIARRAGLGLARTGSTAHHGSGEIFLALSTAPDEPLPDADLDPLFEATVDATEEAVVNALWHAEMTVGREGRIAHALPHDAVLELLDRHRRV
jgi:D-aminopeptidase